MTSAEEKRAAVRRIRVMRDPRVDPRVSDPMGGLVGFRDHGPYGSEECEHAIRERFDVLFHLRVEDRVRLSTIGNPYIDEVSYIRSLVYRELHRSMKGKTG